MRVTKIELQQANDKLAADNLELRKQLSILRAEIDMLKAQPETQTRKALLDRARELNKQGHYVVVVGDQLKDYGPRRH
jgi:prefoldin subunit 5